jgi:hypothetical protein
MQQRVKEALGKIQTMEIYEKFNDNIEKKTF